jgi:hypothetical protein
VDNGGTAKSRRTRALGCGAGATTRRAAARLPHRAAPVPALERRPGRHGGRDASPAACDPRASRPSRPDHPGESWLAAGAPSQRGRVGRPGGCGPAGGAAPGRRRSTGGAGCLTADGADRLARLSALHLEELRRFAPQLEALWDGLDMSLEAASGRVTYDPELGCLGWSRSASVRRTWAAMRWRWGSAAMPATAPNTNQNQKMACISSSSPPLERSYRGTILNRSTAAGSGLDDGDQAPSQHTRSARWWPSRAGRRARPRPNPAASR